MDECISGYIQRNNSQQEIAESCLYGQERFGLINNEGFQILEESTVQNPSDFSIMFLRGYGFATFRGGPTCYYEDTKVTLS